MPFEKGQGGRKPGAKNKSTAIREAFARIEKDFDTEVLSWIYEIMASGDPKAMASVVTKAMDLGYSKPLPDGSGGDEDKPKWLQIRVD